MYVQYSSLEQFTQTTIWNIIYLILKKTTQKKDMQICISLYICLEHFALGHPTTQSLRALKLIF